MSVRLFVLCFTSICCEICFCPNIASILSISMCLPKLQSTELSWPPSLILLSNSKAFREVNSKNSGGSCWLYQTMPPCYISYILWRAMHVCLFLCRLVMYIERDLRKTAPLDRTGDQHTCLSVWIYWLDIWVTQVPHYWVQTSYLSSWVYCSVVISLACVGVCTSN